MLPTSISRDISMVILLGGPRAHMRTGDAVTSKSLLCEVVAMTQLRTQPPSRRC